MSHPEFFSKLSAEHERAKPLICLCGRLQRLQERIEMQRALVQQCDIELKEAQAVFKRYLEEGPNSEDMLENRRFYEAGGEWNEYYEKKENKLQLDVRHCYQALEQSVMVLEELQEKETELKKALADLLIHQPG